MEVKNHLGIYISKSNATVVCLGPQGKETGVLGCFSVSTESMENPDQHSLIDLIARTCAEKLPTYRDCEVAIALDCSMFMQHNLHSDFSDLKQISATIRFDTEEALATDVSDIAIAFEIASSGPEGSDLNVFTTQQNTLSELLLALQSNSIDPVTIEPDVNCLSRFIRPNLSSSEQLQPMFAMLSARNGYLITFTDQQSPATMRTFLLGAKQNRLDLLRREVPLTSALAKTSKPISLLPVFDTTGSINPALLSEALCIEVRTIDVAQAAGTEPETLADCTDQVEFAIAYGAAMTHLKKAESVDFRKDFMPYEGKKMKQQKALKLAGIAVIVLMIALGLYFQLRIFTINGEQKQWNNKLTKQYAALMSGKKPPARFTALKGLQSEVRRIKNVKSGQLSAAGKTSVPAKLTLILGAFNECAAQTKLNINSVSITDKSISITGDTSNRPNTIKLREAIKKTKLGTPTGVLNAKGGRDTFIISIATNK